MSLPPLLLLIVCLSMLSVDAQGTYYHVARTTPAERCDEPDWKNPFTVTEYVCVEECTVDADNNQSTRCFMSEPLPDGASVTVATFEGTECGGDNSTITFSCDDPEVCRNLRELSISPHYDSFGYVLCGEYDLSQAQYECRVRADKYHPEYVPCYNLETFQSELDAMLPECQFNGLYGKLANFITKLLYQCARNLEIKCDAVGYEQTVLAAEVAKIEAVTKIFGGETCTVLGVADSLGHNAGYDRDCDYTPYIRSFCPQLPVYNCFNILPDFKTCISDESKELDELCQCEDVFLSHFNELGNCDVSNTGTVEYLVNEAATTRFEKTCDSIATTPTPPTPPTNEPSPSTATVTETGTPTTQTSASETTANQNSSEGTREVALLSSIIFSMVFCLFM